MVEPRRRLRDEAARRPEAIPALAKDWAVDVRGAVKLATMDDIPSAGTVKRPASTFSAQLNDVNTGGVAPLDAAPYRIT